MKTVIITGSREYRNTSGIKKVMLALCTELGSYRFVHGAAKGADSIGAFIYTNVMHQKEIQEYPAKWDKYGQAAGSIRNREMLDTELTKNAREDILVIAFPMSRSIGTYHMIHYAQKCNVQVRIYNQEGEQIHATTDT